MAQTFYKLVRIRQHERIGEYERLFSFFVEGEREIEFKVGEWVHDFDDGIGIACFRTKEDFGIYREKADHLFFGLWRLYRCEGRGFINRKYLPGTSNTAIWQFYLRKVAENKIPVPLGTVFFKSIKLLEEVEV
jgi:hypothetical protein